MIITKEVEIKINYLNIKHYNNLGYNNICYGNKLIVPVEHLPKKSKIIVLTKCMTCNNEKNTPYATYINSIKCGGYYCCSLKCSIEKRKKTNLEKYGTECTFQSENVKNKIKKTNLERYGAESASKSEEIKNKVKKQI